MENKDRNRVVIKTIAAMTVLLVFFFAQGAVVVIRKIEGTESALVRGGVIWILVLLTLGYLLLRKRRLFEYGFRKPEAGTVKTMDYFVPLLVIAALPLVNGVDLTKGTGFVLANLFLTLAIGSSEELIFRGIICGMWINRGKRKAIVVSSVLFGLCHLLNLAGGAGLVATVLQICFAFVYGVVFAVLFICGRSLLPCILLHAFHDLCSFISMDGTAKGDILIGTLQFLILIGYCLILVRKNNLKK